MRTHRLKIKHEYFSRLELGQKTCEIRLDDRDYQVGDLIYFHQEWMSSYFQITHITRWIGLKDGYVALSLKKVKLNRNGNVIKNDK